MSSETRKLALPVFRVSHVSHVSQPAINGGAVGSQPGHTTRQGGTHGTHYRDVSREMCPTLKAALRLALSPAGTHGTHGTQVFCRVRTCVANRSRVLVRAAW